MLRVLIWRRCAISLKSRRVQWKEARSLLEQNVKHEKETDACVSKWRRQNAKWLRKRKRVEKTEAPIVEERGRVQNTDISRAKMMEKLSESFKPTILLSDDGNLKAKNEFKAAMDKYYKYNRDNCSVTGGHVLRYISNFLRSRHEEQTVKY